MVDMKTNVQRNDGLSIKDFVALCIEKWKWFAVTVTLFLLLAIYYILSASQAYTRSMSVLIKDTDNAASPIPSELSTFSGMSGLLGAQSNVFNEMLAMSSPFVVQNVVKRLHLDMNYTTKDGLRNKMLYGKTLPIILEAKSLQDEDYAKFKVDLHEDGTLKLTVKKKNKDNIDEEYQGKLNSVIKTAIGAVNIKRNDKYVGALEEMTITVSKSPLSDQTEACNNSFSATLSDKDASVIDLQYKDNSVERTEDFLNTVVEIYGEEWVKDKNKVTLSTAAFIDDRLNVIAKELGVVDSDISNFKSANLIPDLKEATKMYMANANEATAQLIQLHNNLYVASYIREFLDGQSKKDQLLPSNMIAGEKELESQISQYNTLILSRNDIVANSSENSPVLVDLDKKIDAMRAAIQHSIDNAERQTKLQVSGLEKTIAQNNEQIASTPKQAKSLLSVERQQKVKEALYIYLLQKREETVLNQTFTAYNTRIITPPMGKKKPTSPKGSMILLLALFMGFAIPAFFIYMKESMDTKVRGKKDVEGLSMPYIGEIPLYKSKDDASDNAIVVKAQSRNLVNEAFRVIRTNMEFMLSNQQGSQAIIVTSMSPGSGKTFVTMNLAMTFALKGKKVIILDLDLRKASLSEYVGQPKHGVANYLTSMADTWREWIVKYKDTAMDILPCGPIPPNPSELLSNGRLGQLFEQLKEHYDYIFIDSAPVDIVADTNIIAGLADQTLFIVRSGLLERDMLPIVDSYYSEKKLKNMVLVLNGTESKNGKHGSHRHGYGYGYGYGSYTKEEA